MATIEDTIASLEAKLAQAIAKKQQIESRKRAIENKQKRANETRKKILIGASILSEIENDRFSKEKLLEILDSNLTKPTDRKLFLLPQNYN